MKEDTKRIKHSKYKNTGLLFELLVRQTTSDVLNEKSDSVAIRLVKKYFGKNKPLSKELKLYKTLMESKFSNENRAKELITETIDARSRLSSVSLRKEKYNLIKDIKENFDLEEFFKNKLTNYKELASIYKLFESETSDGELLPDEKVMCRHTLIEKIINKPTKTAPEKPISDSVFEEYRKQSDDLKKLAYKMMIEKFNQKYESLDTRQKNLLREFIYNSTDVASFRSFVNDQINEVKTELSKNATKIKDKGTQIKVVGVLEHLDKLKQTKGTIKDEHLVQLMRYFQLTKEVNRVIETKGVLNKAAKSKALKEKVNG